MPILDASANRSNALNQAVARLRAGEPVGLPTETVYGLAGDATNGEAVAKIYALKGRPSFNPLICHVDGLVMAQEYGLMSDTALRLATTFWPGPLTLVVPLRETNAQNTSLSQLSELVTAGLGTVGLRCPAGLARQIISAFGKPLAAPSANKSGRVSPTTAEHVAQDHRENDLLIIDDGPCEVGLESTILKIIDDKIILLRHGAITAEDIFDAVGVMPLDAEAKDGIQAPGMLASHYAPNARVRLDCERCDGGSAWLGFGNRTAPKEAKVELNLSPSSNLVEAAANLYGYLKKLDASGADCICVAPIPMEGLGIAINDRLTRAAAPRDAASETPLAEAGE